MGLTSTPTNYPVSIVDAHDSSIQLGTAYLSDEVVSASGFATAYVVEYSKEMCIRDRLLRGKCS